MLIEEVVGRFTHPATTPACVQVCADRRKLFACHCHLSFSSLHDKREQKSAPFYFWFFDVQCGNIGF
jgi:hypothetical protein